MSPMIPVNKCLLCGKKKLAAICIFCPTATFARTIGVKERVIGYVLCPKCMDKPDKIDLVEREMERLARDALAVVGPVYPPEAS